ncbi:hypothetical protein I350_06140 [Cryptococcus amylolentus CBS 6273]|uniref:Amine oxidase domain-containing protein n=1 Tax=Cryptococcus amylolentus CBS 6273 TaxID=1296118 RepID=A0A1E3JQZ5_9TREE|nr:hypothetical protein I350_06140 [Cryptococcus amylolentus CBS 6273]
MTQEMEKKEEEEQKKLKIAIIGGGVSGLSALWVLNEYTTHEVHIYEKDSWWGGHAHTVGFQQPGKEPCQIDTAFIAINAKNYPNFHRFITTTSHAVDLITTTMSFSLSRDGGAFEWASTGFWGLFCQGINLFKPRVYRMMWDIFRFHIFAKDFLSSPPSSAEEGMSIGEYLDREQYSQAFKEDYLLPLTAGIWSIPPDKVALDFPALALIRFFHNHQMLQLWGRPAWLTVKGGSGRYVDKIGEGEGKGRLHLGEGVQRVVPLGDGRFGVVERGGEEVVYDKVILATHTDQAVQLLGENISAEEKEVLGGCEWSPNEAVVHYDEALMPVRKSAWTAWNYLTSTTNAVEPGHESKTTASDVSTISITFDLNVLQSLPIAKHGHIFVTLNPPTPPSPSKTLSRWVYHHPLLTPSLLSAQKRLPSIQGVRGLYFAGAWTGYGFHEDGWRTGMEIAYRPEFGIPESERPWEIVKVDGRDIKREAGEWLLRPLVGGIDSAFKGFAGWMWWSAGMYVSVIHRLFGVKTKSA